MREEKRGRMLAKCYTRNNAIKEAEKKYYTQEQELLIVSGRRLGFRDTFGPVTKDVASRSHAPSQAPRPTKNITIIRPDITAAGWVRPKFGRSVLAVSREGAINRVYEAEM